MNGVDDKDSLVMTIDLMVENVSIVDSIVSAVVEVSEAVFTVDVSDVNDNSSVVGGFAAEVVDSTIFLVVVTTDEGELTQMFEVAKAFFLRDSSKAFN
jgi:acyl-coenzyme A thioesterase PaaI-like protein